MTATVLTPSTSVSVERAVVAVVVAVTAGAVEAVLRTAVELDDPGSDVGALASGLGIRALVYLVVLGIAFRLRAGDGWARTTLAVGLGTVGLASLVVEPMAATLSANGFGELIDDLDPVSVLIGVVRIVHIVAVVAALRYMFRRDARDRFAGRG
ncbi:hypothetical protein [Antrihabitans spumae]|uniref:DUF2127 domain-containing protein n=1 Tax=Antrihabitans spumae TaxID=3373370 RepID=A0ABW7K8C1_9NOCA